MVVVPNYQTMGTLFVGVMTSVATWFMFGYRSPNNDLSGTEEDLYSYLSNQRKLNNPIQSNNNRFYKNAVGVPESMYPKQIELTPIRSIDYSVDQILLVSAPWLPRHSHYLKLVYD
jgi:hypothetical protein